MSSSNISQNGTVPEWLLKNNDYKAAEKSHSQFLRKTLGTFSDVFLNEFLSEKHAGRSGLLQAVDPRVKLLTLLFFAVFASCVSSVPVIIAEALVAVLYASQSGLNLHNYLRRVWGYLPPIMFIVSLPGATSFFSAGEPLFYIIKNAPFAPHGVYFTAAGLAVALRIALRCGVSLGFGYLIFITTRMAELEKSLNALKLPQIFVSVLGMAYRYIFVLTEIASNMVEARFLRTVGKLKGESGRRFFAHGAATLFIRSQRLSSDVYDAMCCRCYTGRAVSLRTLKISAQDFIFIASNAIIVAILLFGVYLL